jgi:hypothetical protein
VKHEYKQLSELTEHLDERLQDSMAMLAKGSSPSVFLPVMTSIIAYWLPAPSRD